MGGAARLLEVFGLHDKGCCVNEGVFEKIGGTERRSILIL